jgi:hypothetical protein
LLLEWRTPRISELHGHTHARVIFFLLDIYISPLDSSARTLIRNRAEAQNMGPVHALQAPCSLLLFPMPLLRAMLCPVGLGTSRFAVLLNRIQVGSLSASLSSRRDGQSAMQRTLTMHFIFSHARPRSRKSQLANLRSVLQYTTPKSVVQE